MNSWLLIRRLRGPAFVIMVGITALLEPVGCAQLRPQLAAVPDPGRGTGAGRTGSHRRGPSCGSTPLPRPVYRFGGRFRHARG